MVTRAFVAERAVDNHEIRRRLHGEDLTGRGHAHKKTAARCEQFLGDKDRKRGADNAAQDAIFMPAFTKDIEVGVVASPSGVADGQSSVA